MLRIFLFVWLITAQVATGATSSKKFYQVVDGFLKYEYTDSLKAKQFLNLAFKEAFAAKDHSLIARAYQLKGWYYEDRSDISNALQAQFKSLEHYKKAKNQQGVSNAYGNLGLIYQDLGNYDKALFYQNKAYVTSEKLFRECSQKKDIGGQVAALKGKNIALANLGDIYSTLKQHEKALSYLQKALDNWRASGDSLEISIAMTNLAIQHKRIGEFEKALKYYRSALPISRKLNRTDMVGITFNNMSNVFDELGQKDSVAYYLDSAISIFKRLNDETELTYVYNNKAKLLLSQGDYKNAEEYLMLSLAMSSRNNLAERKMTTRLFLYQLYKTTGRTDKALLSYEAYVRLKDSIFSIENERNFTRQAVSFEFARKDEIKTLQHQAEVNRQRQYTYYGIAGLLLAIVVALFLFRGNRIKQRSNRMLAEKNDLISVQKERVEKQKVVIEEKQKEIIDSINYAQRIQQSLLPPVKYIERNIQRLKQKKN